MNALVTAVTSDLGYHIAKKLITMGYHIIGTYHSNYLRKEEIQKELGDNISIYKVDITKEEDIINLSKKIDSLNIIINNACTYHDSNIQNKTKEDFMNTLEVNLLGPFLITKHLKLDSGYIFNIASTDGINTYNDINFDYAASKAGLINYTKSLSVIFPNTKSYAISPNWINTKTTRSINKDYLKEELKKCNQSRLIEPEEISEIIGEVLQENIPSGTNIVINIKNNKMEVSYE